MNKGLLAAPRSALPISRITDSASASLNDSEAKNSLVQGGSCATAQCGAQALRHAASHIKIPEMQQRGALPGDTGHADNALQSAVPFTPFVFHSGSWPANILSEHFHLPATRKIILGGSDWARRTLQRAGASWVSWRYLQHPATAETATGTRTKLLQLKGLINRDPWEYSCTLCPFPSLLSGGKEMVLILV